ncbi:hypothetical protein HOY80DRAFT_1036897 [Tuber brumale]|nr:hypothetical protein HOY80DRAFT_1036897 [Tuber brumale]
MSGNPHAGKSERSMLTETPSPQNERASPQTLISSLNPANAQPAPSPARLAEASRMEEERRLRAAEFELRARNMGITGERSVAEKVAIWEGMWAAEQAGNDIQVGAPYFPLTGYSGTVAD